MKILQVQRVIPHLVHRRAIKSLFANLELDDKYNSAIHHHRVNPSSHASDVEFQKQ